MIRRVVIVSAVWSAYVIVAASDGGFALWDLLLFILPGGAAVVLALTIFLTGAVRALVVPRWRPSLPGLAFGSTLQAACVLLAVVAIWTDVPLRARLALSEGALQHRAESMRPGESLYDGEWIGLYNVEAAYRKGDGVLFVLGTDGLMNYCGVVFAPTGVPPPEFSCRAIRGPWFKWHGFHGSF